jgi:hypothetical protein
MKWISRLRCGKSDRIGVGDRKTPKEEINIQSSPSTTEEDTPARCCRICGGTSGLYSGDDICSSCDVSYYS